MLILFAGEDYYPTGGGGDFMAVVESIEEAAAMVVATDDKDWAHVLDTDTGERVAQWHVLTHDHERWFDPPYRWIEGEDSFIPTEPSPPPPAPPKSDGVKDRAWVEAWYAARRDPAPRADDYDEAVVIGGHIFYLAVRSRLNVGFDWAVREWDSYRACPHWAWHTSDIAATETEAWEAARAAAKSRARLYAKWRAERQPSPST